MHGKREVPIDPQLVDTLNESLTPSPEDTLIAAEDEDEDFSGFDTTH